jgi:nitrile hydratase
VLEKGFVTEEEMAERTERYSAAPEADVPVRQDQAKANQVMSRILRLETIRIEDSNIEPRFSLGETVRARNMQYRGHTRLPRYLRGKLGVVERYDGIYDVHDHERADEPLPPPEPLYAARFDSRQVWGSDAEPGEIVADLWERYLEPPS